MEMHDSPLVKNLKRQNKQLKDKMDFYQKELELATIDFNNNTLMIEQNIEFNKGRQE